MKKTNTSLILVAALLTVVSINPVRLAAKTKNPPPGDKTSEAAVQQPSDPFVKNGEETSPRMDAGAHPDELCFTIEVYSLPQDEAASLIESNPGSDARYSAVRDLVKSGKARFETLLSSATKNEQQTEIRQFNEIQCASEWKRSKEKGQPNWPINYEYEYPGEELTFKVKLSADNSLSELELKIESDRLLGFDDIRAREQDQPVGRRRMELRKLETSQQLVMGKTTLLGTLNSAPQFSRELSPAAQEVRLVFGRVVSATHDQNEASDQSHVGSLEQVLVFYSLDREAARKILAGDFKPGSYYTAVRALEEKQKARLERMTLLRTKPSVRSSLNESDVTPMPVQFDISYNPFDYQPSELHDWDFGLSMSIEPVVSENGALIDMNLVPEIAQNLGKLKANGVAAQYPALPVIEERRISTAFTAAPGEPAFIGTFSPTGDTGVNDQKDTGTVWLGFILTTYPKP